MPDYPASSFSSFWRQIRVDSAGEALVEITQEARRDRLRRRDLRVVGSGAGNRNDPIH
ncbi:MAG TPA: hypothetical protein VMK12_22635 [Anaeromyxobacteraceae bacterium]|nr:hypothetical protein [Anaeromyxobacteraceae bacterium]